MLVYEIGTDRSLSCEHFGKQPVTLKINDSEGVTESEITITRADLKEIVEALRIVRKENES